MQTRTTFTILCIVILTAIFAAAPVGASTTDVHVVKLANDGTSILNETTKNYQWLETNLPVLGDGTTHYYSQGPTFNSSDLWDNVEFQNVETRDWNAVKGTDVKDLADLVGGMSQGETVKITASDGFSNTFPYDYIYTPDPRQGSMGITWYRQDQGYVASYADGMRLVMFADAKTNTYGWNTSGWHVFGNADMRDCWAPQYWYNYSGTWPSSGGVSVKYVSEIIIYSNQAPPGPVDTLFDGTVNLTPDTKFTLVPYNNPTASYLVNTTTPLGALDSVNKSAGIRLDVTDKSYATKNILMVDNIGNYLYSKSGSITYTWICQLNGVTLDDYGAPSTDGLNIKSLANGDQVNFYYGMKPVTPSNATAVVKIKVNISQPGPVVDTLFDGTVNLTADSKFTLVPYNNPTASYQVNTTTPLGALNSVNVSAGIRVDVTDKSYATKNILMVDNIGNYLYSKSGSITYTWICQINGVTLDDYGAPSTDGLNIKSLANGDQVNFYYGMKPVTPSNATAVVKIKVNTGSQPSAPDWTLSLSGAQNKSVTKTYFEQGLACSSSGHQVFWTDTDNNIWGGVPLWVLVGMVDDNPDVGPDHFNFNDSIAAQGYSVKVVSGDGWDTTFSSQNIARNNSYIVANTLNGQLLPRNTTSDKLSWPLHMKGAAVFGGQQVGNITRIELTGLPQPTTDWTLTMQGEVTDTITKSYFVEAIACKHNESYTDSNNDLWQGVALWDLVGAVDDIETTSHFTFNDTRAAIGYTIRVSAGDGFNATFVSSDVARNNGYIVAYKKNGVPLTDSSAPLKLVGSATTSGKQRVGNITTISLEGLPDQFPPGDWQLDLVGQISATIPQPEFEYWASCHDATYTDTSGNVYTGVPLWRLMGWVDDRIPHGPNGFNDAAAAAGYKVIVKAGDGYEKEFTSQSIGKNDNYIIANTMNGAPLPATGSHPPYPLRLVGSSATGGNSVGNIVEIQLTDFQTPVTTTPIQIIKYAADRVTIISQTNVTYLWMEANLAVIGDGNTTYKFEGLTLDPSNLWDPEETYPGGFKISNVVKGSRVKDLVELVGGMDSGTEITFVASDGFETTLPYSSIYTNPAVQARQGDAILAWWGDGQYVPNYADGMRLFFTPEGDHVYGQWDMHETLPSAYWRYNFQSGVQYPSCAGLSAKLITSIKVYSSAESDWSLVLDGRDIGGIYYNVSKPYFEEALACQFGANHDATYTDSSGRVWEGIPLWFLCGFVDDADQHSSKSYNDTKALAGYNIIVTGSDGYSATFDSRGTIRNSNYIVANTLNGTHILSTDSSWPLRLVGQNVTGSQIVKKVASIKLTKMTTVGVFRDGVFYRNGATDIVYGLPTDTPVIGDWNGDGMSEAGVYRGGVFYRNGATDIVYGLPTDTPVIGDWNGDHISEVGVYRDGVFYRKDATDIVYGLPTDTPVIGDWNGDHISEVGVYRDGVFYRKDATDIVYGLPTDTPVIGDWNGDGTSEAGVWRNSDGSVFYLRTSDVDTTTTPYGLSTDTPIAGKWI